MNSGKVSKLPKKFIAGSFRFTFFIEWGDTEDSGKLSGCFMIIRWPIRWFVSDIMYTARQRSCGKVIFSVGGGVPVQGTDPSPLFHTHPQKCSNFFNLYLTVQAIPGHVHTCSLWSTDCRKTGRCLITIRKRSCRKVMFLHLSVSYFVHRVGACVVDEHAWQWACAAGACMVGVCMAEGVHGGGMHGGGVRGSGGVHGRKRRPLQWTVRILLECILVLAKNLYNREQKLHFFPPSWLFFPNLSRTCVFHVRCLLFTSLLILLRKCSREIYVNRNRWRTIWRMVGTEKRMPLLFR